MFKEFAQLSQILGQARQLSGKVTAVQQQLAELRITGRSRDGRVTVVLSGQGQMIDCNVSPELLVPLTGPALEQAVIDATNSAREQVREAAMRLMGDAVGGLDLNALAGMLPGFGSV